MKNINGIDLIESFGEIWMYQNTLNGATVKISNGDISYNDSYGNYMLSYRCHLRINSDFFRITTLREEFKKYDGGIVVMLPKEEIQEIANQTFYADGQFHAIDFLTFNITEENQ